MQPKFLQTEYIYKNNEYENMPSIGHWCGERLTTKSKSKIDWDLVKKIVEEHYNLKYCLVNATFGYYDEIGVYESEFVLYHKLLIDSQWLERKRAENDYEAIGKWMTIERQIPIILHDCVHELDEQTELCFRTGWAGNIGIFGSHDVSRTTYSFGDEFNSWENISKRWSPSINDTRKHFDRNGVYMMMTSRYLKK